MKLTHEPLKCSAYINIKALILKMHKTQGHSTLYVLSAPVHSTHTVNSYKLREAHTVMWKLF